MSINLNHVMLAGHLTRDPQIKALANGSCVAAFSLAINRRFKGPEGDQKEEVTFVDCEAWRRTAELIGQYLVKGSACLVEGRLKLDSWQDKEGQQRSRLKVVVESVQFIGKTKGKDDPVEISESQEPVTAAATAAATAPGKRPAPVAVAQAKNDPPF